MENKSAHLEILELSIEPQASVVGLVWVVLFAGLLIFSSLWGRSTIHSDS
jgi:hypothetical protein